MKLIKKKVISGYVFFNNCIERNHNHTSLRDKSGYQNGWIFGKVLNGSWPPPPTPQNGPHLWKSCACISYYLALVPPCIYSTISIIKKMCNIIFRIKGRLEFFRKFIWFGKNHPSLFSFNFQSHKLRSFHLVTNPTGEMWKYRANIVNGSTNLGDLLPTQQPKIKTKTARISLSPRGRVPNNVFRYLPDRFFLAPSVSFLRLTRNNSVHYVSFLGNQCS